ncbi:AAA family ATPase [Proteiniclasticum sp. C24MP]|uniref:AAA family ATPase n=1 Tax=Proteiniclasticum sp. C24MP TaxID=3374101 RepID=UPI003754E2EF
MDRIRLMILENNEEKRIEIESILKNIDYIMLSQRVDSRDDAMRVLDLENISVVIIGKDFEEDGYDVAEEITTEHIDVAIILIEDEIREEVMHKALFSGAKDVVIRPIVPNRLMDSIFKAYELNKKRVDLHRDVPQRVKRKSELGQIITVFSTKGGVGKTFVSINLAVTLAKETKKRVVVVDLDLDFGSASLALNIQPKFTISDVVNDIKNIDPDLIESYLLMHDSGVRILPANIEPQMNDFINSEHIQVILRTLQNSYDYIVVDMPGRFYEPINPAFVFADKLLMITTPEVSTVRNIKASLMTLNDLNYPKSKIKLLLNKADRRGEVKAGDIEKTLNQTLFSSIDADYKGVMSSLNQGVPYVTKNSRSTIAKNFKKLAKKVTDDQVEKTATK